MTDTKKEKDSSHMADCTENAKETQKEISKVSPIHNAIRIVPSSRFSKHQKDVLKNKYGAIWSRLLKGWFAPIGEKSTIEAYLISSGIESKISLFYNPDVDKTGAEKKIEGLYDQRDIVLEDKEKKERELLKDVFKYDKSLRPEDFKQLPDGEGKSDYQKLAEAGFHNRQIEISDAEEKISAIEKRIEEVQKEGEPVRDKIVERLNESYAVILEPKVFFVKLQAKVFTTISKDTFKDTLENARIPKGFSDESEADVFLKHPKRKTYRAVTINPAIDGHYDDLYNLWDGFAIESKKGSCELYQQHMLNVICGGNKESFDFLWKLMAYWIQKPAERTCAILMRGGQGLGKGTFVRPLSMIFGKAFGGYSRLESIFGQFNYAIADKVLLFADEALYGGNKSLSGAIKALVTEETYSVEEKFKPQLNLPNFRKLIVASNNAFAIPLDADDRRFFCLNTSDKFSLGEKYFKALHAEISNGGAQALLYDLAKTDLTGFNPWAKPENADGFDLALECEGTFVRFLYDVLEEERFSASFEWSETCSFLIAKNALMDFYRDWVSLNDRNARLRSKKTITIELGKIFAKCEGFNPKARGGSGDRPRCYSLPCLKDAKTAFAKRFKTLPEDIF